jgi:hypothetical protein
MTAGQMKHQRKRPDASTFDGVPILAGPRSAFRQSKRCRKLRSFRKASETQRLIEQKTKIRRNENE